MAYKVHRLITLRGTLGTGSAGTDTWQFGLRFEIDAAQTVVTNLVPEVNLTKCFDAAKIMLGSAGIFSGSITLDEARGAVIGPLGKAVGITTVVAPASKGVGTSQANLHPWSTALVVTLDAGGVRGGRLGRIYLPCPAVPVTLDGRITPANRANYLAVATTFLNSCQGPAAGGDNLNLVVASARFESNRPVTSIRIGDVLDTQRRRDNRLNEGFAVGPLN